MIQSGNCICYQVARNDTLSSIAAQFDLSLSELKTLNHLMGNAVVFPGQTMYVPAKESLSDSSSSSVVATPTEEKDKPFQTTPVTTITSATSSADNINTSSSVDTAPVSSSLSTTTITSVGCYLL